MVPQVMAEIEVKRIYVVVDGIEDEPPKKDANTRAPYTGKARITRAVIVTSIGGRSLRVVENTKTSKAMWDKINTRYEVASTASKINLLASLIIARYQDAKDLGDYIAELDFCFNKLGMMGLPVARKRLVTIMLQSVMNEESLKSTVAALKSMDGDRATSDRECSGLLEESLVQRMIESASTSGSSQLRAATV